MKNQKSTWAALLTTTCLFAASLNAADATTQAAPTPAPAQEKGALPINPKGDLTKEEINTISVALGHYLGRNLKTPGIVFDVDGVVQGLRDGAAGKPAPMTDADFEATMALLQKRAHEKQAENNLKAANDYLQTNSKQDKVIELEPGKLQYQILQEGTGAPVQEHGNPQILYSGKYIDGTVFSSSADVGGPINVPLDQTIPGFSKGIKGMKEGEKRRLFIHPDYGYGTMGQLAPNSLLIFDIEVVKAEAPKTAETDDEDDVMPLGLDDDEDEVHHEVKKK